MKRIVLAGVLLAGVAALAADPTPLGAVRRWSEGVVAVNAPVVVAGPQGELPTLVLPRAVADRITGPTLLFYFSPTCPHCRHVAKEVQALSERLAASKTGRVLGIVSGSSHEAELLEFRATYGVTFDVIADADHEILTAMGARSTPSAMLVAPKAGSRGRIEIRDLWYPYLPGFDALVEGRASGDMWKMFAPDAYLGNNTCGVCHVQEHASWLTSHHSVAWRTLTVRNKQADPACNTCHVTGAGKPTGWDGAEDSPFVDVGCEACHGPGGPHDGTRIDAEETCAGCHDAGHSIAFTLDKGLPLIDHYAANGMSAEALEASRRALYAGEAPRDLLAFPSGRNVGSGKCVGCHAVEHGWWVADPHANAMASLRAEGSTDPACVRCHATAKQSGPPPATLAGFDLLGGVGCESCHGPGEAHVAAGGGTTNIQGLGESCPVCVIEAVCTSCHTPKWSPEWNLDQALEKVRHQP